MLQCKPPRYIAERMFRNRDFYYSYFNNTAGTSEIHCHDFYEIFLTVSDNFLHIVNDEEHLLPCGTLVFVRPDDIHRNRFETKHQSYVQLCFTKKIADSLWNYLDADFDINAFKASSEPISVQLTEKDFNCLFQEFRKIEIMDLNNRSQLNKHCKKLLFSIFTSYFEPIIVQQTNDSIPHWLTKALNLSHDELLYINGVDKLVEASGKSYKTLSRNLKRYFGKTPSEYIIDLKLTYAYNLIVTTTLPITDICYECGFNNTSYFFKSFKKKYSETPNKVRCKSKIF